MAFILLTQVFLLKNDIFLRFFYNLMFKPSKARLVCGKIAVASANKAVSSFTLALKCPMYSFSTFDSLAIVAA